MAIPKWRPSLPLKELALGVALCLIAANLRMGITSVGPVVEHIQAGLSMSANQIGILTSIPVICFALTGGVLLIISRRISTDRALCVAITATAVALAIRPNGGAITMLIGSVVACSGIAAANVLMPVAVLSRFPTQIGRMTGLYTASLAGGSALAAGLTVPLVNWIGWRLALAAYATPAALAAIVWFLASHAAVNSSDPPTSARPGRPPDITPSFWRSRRVWSLTLFFGTQSFLAYSTISWLPAILRDAGISAEKGGALLALSILIGIPVALVLTPLAARSKHQSGWAAAVTLTAIVALSGLLVQPAWGSWLWAVLLGVSGGAFPLSLLMFSLRSASPSQAMMLSAFGQSAGYLFAAIGPFSVGALHARTGEWTNSIQLLIGVMIIQAIAGIIAGREKA